MKIARDAIEGMTAEAEIGKIYRGKVVTIKEFGAFVEFLPGKDGLVHISELANFRVKQTEDIVKLGDEIWVKCLWAWTRKAGSVSPAKPPWKTAKRKWPPRPERAALI